MLEHALLALDAPCPSPCLLPLPPPAAPAGQLGAEGFIMGSLYTLVGLAVAGLIFIVPKVGGLLPVLRFFCVCVCLCVCARVRVWSMAVRDGSSRS